MNRALSEQLGEGAFPTPAGDSVCQAVCHMATVLTLAVCLQRCSQQVPQGCRRVGWATGPRRCSSLPSRCACVCLPDMQLHALTLGACRPKMACWQTLSSAQAA